MNATQYINCFLAPAFSEEKQHRDFILNSMKTLIHISGHK